MATGRGVSVVFLIVLLARTIVAERIYVESEEELITRRILADSTLDDDELLDDNGQATVYQQVSGSTGGITINPAVSQNWTISYINASLELDTDATFADNFRADSPSTWEPGSTRFNVTATLSRGSAAPSPSPSLTALLHTKICGGDGWEAAFLNNTKSGGTTNVIANATRLDISSSNSVSANNTNVTRSTVFNYLVDYDQAKAVVIYANGLWLACQNLRPPFPDFPSDWSTTVERTDVDNGRTFVYQQTYSRSLNKYRIDLHSFGSDRIITTDANSGKTTIIVPQNGSCSSRSTGRRLNYLTEADNTTLVSTAERLFFTKDNNVTYVPGFQTVRYANATFDVQYYFPVNQWLVGREDYHRLLKRVYSNGTFNGEPYESYEEYVNFRPRTVYNALFDTCAISPYGKNCNCTDQLRKAAFSNVSAVIAGDEDISVNGAASAACEYGPSVPHGFIRAQSGPYVGLTIIGMVGGSLITFIAMYFFYRKRVGVRITDNLGHQKFSDVPGS